MRDADVEAANEIYKAAQEQANIELAKLKSEMVAVRDESHALGILQKIDYDISHNKMLKYVVLYKLKEKKMYRKGGLTWAGFCEAIGESTRRVDEILKDLSPIVSEFSADSADLLGLPFNKIRYLGRSISAESAEINSGCLVIDGTKIPLTPENKDDIEALIDTLKETQKRQIEEKDTKLRVKDRVLKEKERVIQKQEKVIGKYDREANRQGFEPGEENFINEMKNLQTQFSGYEMRIDPRIVPEDATPRMIAAYLEALGYMRRVVSASYDTAIIEHGNPKIDNGWVQPDLRESSNGAE